MSHLNVHLQNQISSRLPKCVLLHLLSKKGACKSDPSCTGSLQRVGVCGRYARTIQWQWSNYSTSNIRHRCGTHHWQLFGHKSNAVKGKVSILPRNVVEVHTTTCSTITAPLLYTNFPLTTTTPSSLISLKGTIQLDCANVSHTFCYCQPTSLSLSLSLLFRLHKNL
mgnify:CR=1 FL=1